MARLDASEAVALRLDRPQYTRFGPFAGEGPDVEAVALDGSELLGMPVGVLADDGDTLVVLPAGFVATAAAAVPRTVLFGETGHMGRNLVGVLALVQAVVGRPGEAVQLLVLRLVD